MIDINLAVISLAPNVSFSTDNGEIVGWDTAETPTGIAQPTQTEIDAEILRLQAEYDSKQYQRDRALAYPSLEEQADMAYWDRQNGTTTLDDAISAVKAQYPKP